MRKIVINGDFLCRNITGIERFAFEICRELDKIISKNEFSIFIPKNAPDIHFFNINIIRSEKRLKTFATFQQFVYGKYLKKNNVIGLDFSNNCAIVKPGIVFIHDIYAKLYPKDFSSFKDKLIKIYMCMMYFYAVRCAKLLLTVSEFSRKQISEAYKIPEEKIFVIPNGWDHFLAIEDDFSIFEKFPLLKARDFYFTL